MALLPVAEALARVLEGAESLPVERVPLAEAEGRVLAEDIAARRTQPPDDVSAMDGYAVRAEDVGSAPARLKLVGEVAAGRPFDGAVRPGEAVRIFTGGVLPPGSDTIVIQENTAREGDLVIVKEPATRAKNVRVAGLDFREGHVGLHKGRRLTGRDVSLAAAMNHATLPVHRRPKVAIAATGDELVPPGTEPKPGQIVHSNIFAIAALARQAGGEPIDLGIWPDKLDETIAGVRRARESADVLVTTGGASVGDYDLVQPALAAEGLALSFWKIAMRPGKPLMSGRLGAMHVLGLPGNPVSTYVCSLLFLVPLIRCLSGRADLALTTGSGVLGRDLKANDERAEYMRATLTMREDGTAVATPFPVQDSSMLVPLAAADCLVIHEPFAPAGKAGSPCVFVRLDD
jgi:molybdopterin molybdotransferase